jgi:hypothetical protein
MTTDNLCFYLQNRLIQTSQTEGQQYNDTSPFSIYSLPLIRGHIFSQVRLLYELAVSNLDRSMHRSLWV